MSTYKYYKTVEKTVDVSPCPCCGHEDLEFYDDDGDWSVHHAEAEVVCKNCGHKVSIKGNEIQSESGRTCQFRAIDKWNSQYKMYRNPDVDALEKELAKVKAENNVLKTVMLMENFNLTYSISIDEPEKAELYNRFSKILREFRDSSGFGGMK